MINDVPVRVGDAGGGSAVFAVNTVVGHCRDGLDDCER